MTYDQWKTTDPREYTQPDEEEQSELEWVYGELRIVQQRVARLTAAMKHVVNELEEHFGFDLDDGQPNLAMRLANELNEAMYGPGGF